MTDLDLTWATGEPCVLVNPQLVRYTRDEDVIRAGKKVVERTVTEFTVATVRPATEREVNAWKAQP